MAMPSYEEDNSISSSGITICGEERQRFIDCVYLNSKCVQAGRKSFTECLKEESHNPNEECKKLFGIYLRCRAQLSDSRTRFRGYR